MPNEENFVKLIKDNEGILFKISTLYTDNDHDGQDLRQEMIYQLWKSFDSFSGKSKISTWMYRVALNTALVHLKKRNKKILNVEIGNNVFQQIDVNDTEIEEQVKKLYNTIKKLKEIERGIILLYLEGKSHEEIGEIMGFTTTNVGTKIGRIKQSLKKLILKS
jgi:RNA polymerase sigma-70 factor (ECF subfamily)